MKTILIIEDDQAIRESLQELLESEGYSTILAENGERGLDIFSQKLKVDLILLDLSMPVMDGKAFLKNFNETYANLGAMPILIMTAAGPGEIPMAYDREMILRKPLDVDIILEKITNSL